MLYVLIYHYYHSDRRAEERAAYELERSAKEVRFLNSHIVKALKQRLVNLKPSNFKTSRLGWRARGERWRKGSEGERRRRFFEIKI